MKEFHMTNLEFRKPYQLQEIIDSISKDILDNGFTNANYCLYSNEDMAKPELLCYLELYLIVTDEDEELYPDFVKEKSLKLFYYGQQFEDVLINVSSQKKSASINDYIEGLNYYMTYDTFMNFE